MQIVSTWYVRFAWFIEKMAAIGREEEALLLLLLARRKRRNKRRQRRLGTRNITIGKRSGRVSQTSA